MDTSAALETSILDETAPVFEETPSLARLELEEHGAEAPARADGSPQKTVTGATTPSRPGPPSSTVRKPSLATAAGTRPAVPVGRASAVTSRLTQSTAASSARASSTTAPSRTGATGARPSVNPSPARPTGGSNLTRPTAASHARTASTASSRGSGMSPPPPVRSAITSPARPGVVSATSSPRKPLVPASPTTNRSAIGRVPVGSPRNGVIGAPSARATSDSTRLLAQKQEELAKKQEELDAFAERVARLEADLDERNTALDAVQRRVESLEASEAQLLDIKEKHAAVISQRDADSKAHSSEIALLQNQLASGKASADEGSTQLLQLREQLATLQTERDTLSGQKAAFDMRHAEADTLREQHLAHIKALQAQVDSHQDLQREFDALRESMTAQQSASAASTAELVSLKERLSAFDQAQEDHEERVTRLAHLSDEMATLQKAFDQQSSQLDALRSSSAQEIQFLKQAASSAGTSSASQIAKLTEEVSRLAAELKEAAEEGALRARDAALAAKTIRQEQAKVVEAREQGRAEALAESAELVESRVRQAREQERTSAGTQSAAALETLRNELTAKAKREVEILEGQLRKKEALIAQSTDRHATSESRYQQLEASHRDHLAQLTAKHETDLKAALDDARAAASGDHSAALEKLRNEHLTSLSEASTARDAALASERTEGSAKLKALEERFQGQYSAIQNEYQSVTQALQQSQDQNEQLLAELISAKDEQGRLQTALESATARPPNPTPASAEPSRVTELEKALGQARAEIEDVRTAMQMTQTNFAQLTDAIQQDHAQEIERRQGLHNKERSKMQMQIEGLRSGLERAKQSGSVPSSPGRPPPGASDNALSELHRAHSSRMADLERQHADGLNKLHAELDRTKLELEMAKTQLAQRAQTV